MFHRTTAAEHVKFFGLGEHHDITVTELDRPPVFVEGRGSMNSQLVQNLKYPISASTSKPNGVVNVLFTISETGDMKVIHVQSHSFYSLDQEALNCVKSLKGKWVPGILNGKPVAVIESIPVVFNSQLKIDATYF